MKKKHLLVLVFSIAIILQIFLGVAYAAYTEMYLEYEIEGESVTIVGYFGNEEETTVPETIAGYAVNKIAAGAFAGSAKLKVIHLPATITEIQSGAFNTSQKVVYAEGHPAAEQHAQQSEAATPAPSAGEPGEDGSEAYLVEKNGELVVVGAAESIFEEETGEEYLAGEIPAQETNQEVEEPEAAPVVQETASAPEQPAKSPIGWIAAAGAAVCVAALILVIKKRKSK